MKPDSVFGSKPITFYDQTVGFVTGYQVYVEEPVNKKFLGFKYKRKRLREGGFVSPNASVRGENKNGLLVLKSGLIESGSFLLDRAVLDDNAKLINKSVARDDSKVLGNAVLDKSTLNDKAVASENAVVKESTIYEHATISGNADVTGSDISGNSIVTDWAIILKNSDISGDSTIGHFTRVGGKSNDIFDAEQYEFDDSQDEESSIDEEDDESRVEKTREIFESCVSIIRQKSSSQLSISASKHDR